MGIPLLKTQGGSLSALLDQAGAVLPGFSPRSHFWRCSVPVSGT